MLILTGPFRTKIDFAGACGWSSSASTVLVERGIPIPIAQSDMVDHVIKNTEKCQARLAVFSLATGPDQLHSP